MSLSLEVAGSEFLGSGGGDATPRNSRRVASGAAPPP